MISHLTTPPRDGAGGAGHVLQRRGRGEPARARRRQNHQNAGSRWRAADVRISSTCRIADPSLERPGTRSTSRSSGLAQTILETGVDWRRSTSRPPARIYVACSAQETFRLPCSGTRSRQHASMTVEFIAASADQAADWTAGGPGILSALVPCAWPTSASSGPRRYRPAAWSCHSPGPRGARTGRGQRAEGRLAMGGAGAGPGSTPASRSVTALQPTRRTQAGAPVGSGFGGCPPRAFLSRWLQPWLSTTHQLGYLVCRERCSTRSNGASISRAAVAEEVARGDVRPSLLHQVDTGLDDPLLLPRRIRLVDRGFRGPGGVVPRQLGGGEVLAVIEAFGRQAIRRVKAYWRRRRPVAGGTVRRPVPSGIQIAPSRSVASR